MSMTAAATFPPTEGLDDLGLTVAGNVRALMARRGVSQTQLADLMKVSQSAISKRLRGVTPFDTRDLQVISRAFGVSAASLLLAPEDHPVNIRWSSLPLTQAHKPGRLAHHSANRRNSSRLLTRVDLSDTAA